MNHVLIVDDEAEIRESLENILTEEGYLVTTSCHRHRGPCPPARCRATTSFCWTSGCPIAMA